MDDEIRFLLWFVGRGLLIGTLLYALCLAPIFLLGLDTPALTLPVGMVCGCAGMLLSAAEETRR